MQFKDRVVLSYSRLPFLNLLSFAFDFRAELIITLIPSRERYLLRLLAISLLSAYVTSPLTQAYNLNGTLQSMTKPQYETLCANGFDKKTFKNKRIQTQKVKNANVLIMNHHRPQRTEIYPRVICELLIYLIIEASIITLSYEQ